MSFLNRRRFIAGAATLAALQATSRARAQQSGHAHHGGLYESLQKPGRIDIPETAATQHVFDSPAPKAANPGRWVAKAPLPLPRSEMAWAVAHADRMHLVGGYGEQRVDRPYHQVYDPAGDRWIDSAAAAQGRQSRRRRGARRHPLCHRRLHRAEPQAAQRMLRPRPQEQRGGLAHNRAAAARLRRHRLRRARRQGARHRRRHRRYLPHQEVGRLARRLRPQGRQVGRRARRCRRAATTPARSRSAI